MTRQGSPGSSDARSIGLAVALLLLCGVLLAGSTTHLAGAQRAAMPAADDGTRIVFDYQDGQANPDIFMVNADGSNLVRLSFNPSSDLLPALSPDGTKIAYSSYRPANGPGNDIYVMNADGSGDRRLTFNTGSTNQSYA